MPQLDQRYGHALPPETAGNDGNNFVDSSLSEISIGSLLPSVGAPDVGGGYVYRPAKRRGPLAFSDGQVCVLGLENTRLRALHSGNRGQTFAPEVDVAGKPGQPEVRAFAGVADSAGRVYVALAVADPGGDVGLQFVRSDDSCRSWTAPVTLVSDGSVQHGVQSISIDVNDAGVVAIEWLGYPDSSRLDYWAIASTNRGGTWKSAVQLETSGGTHYDGLEVEVDPANGNIYATWVQDVSGGPSIYLARSTNQGTSFLAPVALDSTVPAQLNSDYPDVQVAQDGSLLIAFFDNAGTDHVYVVRSTNFGANFSLALDRNLGNDANSAFPTTLVPASGSSTLLLEYVDNQSQLTVQRSANNGASFSAAQILNSTAYDSSLTRTPSGIWAIAWEDFADDTYGATNTEVLVRSSADDGQTWSAAVNADRGSAPSRKADLIGISAPSQSSLFVEFVDFPGVSGESLNLGGNEGPANPLGFGPPIRIDSDSHTAVPGAWLAPTLAADGAQHVYVAAQFEKTPTWADLYVAASSNSGRSFLAPVRVSTSTPGTRIIEQPLIRATSDGYVYILYTSDHPTNGRELHFNRSTDFGATWFASDVVVATFPSLTPGDYWLPEYPAHNMAVLSGGKIYIAWSTDADVFLTRSVDGGSTFIDTKDVDQNTTNGDHGPQLCAQGNQVVLVWRGRNGGNTRNSPWGIVSTDSGATFGSRIQLRPDATTGDVQIPVLACDGTNKAVAVWPDARGGSYRLWSNQFNGTAWGTNAAVTGPTDRAHASPSIAWLDSNNVVVVYDDEPNGASFNYGIFASRSTNQGTSFSSFVRLDQDSPDASRNSFSPRITTDLQGRAWIGWLDTAAGFYYQLVMRRTTDGGATYSSTRRVDRKQPQGTFYSYYESPTVQFASLPGTGFFIRWAQRTSASFFNSDIVVSADDVNDSDRDGVVSLTDCNDADSSIYPGAPQICDGKNNDCNAPGWPTVPENELDGDADSVLDCRDNCVSVANPTQADFDLDGTGNACDALERKSVYPSDNTIGVPVSTTLTATFSEPVDPTTVGDTDADGTPDTFVLWNGTNQVPGRVSVSSDKLQASFDPNTELALDTIYRIELTTGIKEFVAGPSPDGPPRSLQPSNTLFRSEALPPAPIPLPDVSTEANGPAAAAKAGTAVAGLGDINGDGTRDSAAGAPGFDASGGLTEAGAALIYFGTTDTARLSVADIIFTGATSHERAGTSLAGSFDANGDGGLDIVIGAEQVDRTAAVPTPVGAGRVYVIYFDPTDLVHYPNIANPDVPDTVSLALVGQPGGIPGVVFTGVNLGDQVGFSVAFGGKVNPGTGPDLLIGAPGRDPGGNADAGGAYLVFDDPSLSGAINLARVANGAADNVPGIVYSGAAPGDLAGFSTAFVSDVIGGSGEDLAVGAPYNDPTVSLVDAGAAYVISGGSLPQGSVSLANVGGSVAGKRFEGDDAGSLCGFSITPGENNLVDTEEDLLIACPGFDVTVALDAVNADAGMVVEISSQIGEGGVIDVCTVGEIGGLAGVRWLGAAPGDLLGYSMGPVRDVTKNGYSDIVMGAPFSDPLGVSNAGIVYVVEGFTSPSALNGAISVNSLGSTVPGAQLIGVTPGENAGVSLAATGDINGDGNDDYGAGAPGKDASASDAGLTYLVTKSVPIAPRGLCGTTGCLVADLPTGAQLFVPPNALTQNQTLDVVGVLSAGQLPAAAPSGTLFLGAARYTPDGLPIGAGGATLDIPIAPSLQSQVTPGESLRLYRLSGQQWVDEGLNGIVGANPHLASNRAVHSTSGVIGYFAIFVSDTDGDGLRNTRDNCPTISNLNQLDFDLDGSGDVCDACTDSDADGFGNPGFVANACATDNCPATNNPDQADPDADGLGSVCDNCAAIANPNQENADADSLGDVCDTCTDTDHDGFGNPGFAATLCVLDNCPALSNANQADRDADSVGDVCDNCPDAKNTSQADDDLNGVGNACEPPIPTLTVSNKISDGANFSTIQAAVNAAAAARSQVQIYPGNGPYLEAVQVNRSRAFLFVALDQGGATPVVVDGGGAPAFTLSSTAGSVPMVLQGLTLRGAEGVRASVASEMKRITLRSVSGKGLNLLSGDHVIEELDANATVTNIGIDLAAGTTLSLRRSRLVDVGGVAVNVGGQATIQNLLAARCQTGVRVLASGALDMSFATISGSGGIGIENAGVSSVTTTISYGNGNGDMSGISCASVSNSVIGVPNCASSGNNSSGDPLLDAEFRLNGASPALERGPDAASQTATDCLDLDQTPRWKDYDQDGTVRSDAGAFEKSRTAGILPEVQGVVLALPGTVSWSSTIGATEYHVYRGQLTQLSATNSGTCADAEDANRADTVFTDLSLPSLADGWSYLITAESGSAGESTRGAGTCAERRPSPVCP